MPMSLEILQQQASYKSVFRLVNSAVTVARLLLRAPRRAAALCCCGAGRAAIDRHLLDSYPPGPQQQTRRTLLHWVNGTDGRALYRYIICGLLCFKNVNSSFSPDQSVLSF